MEEPKKTKEIKPLVTADEVAVALKKRKTSVIPPDKLKQLVTPSFQRGVMPAQKNKLKAALLNGEHFPNIILAERLIDGKPAYTLLDGLQRVSAAIEVGFPLIATVIEFRNEEDERKHFLAFQRSLKVNPNLLVEVNAFNPTNQKVKLINEKAGHPLEGKIWFGRGKQPNESISATLVASIVDKGLELSDLESFTKLVGTIIPLDRKHPSNRSGAIRGLIAFFLKNRDSGLDTSDTSQVDHLKAFNWIAITATCKNNTKEAGEEIATALTTHLKTK